MTTSKIPGVNLGRRRADQGRLDLGRELTRRGYAITAPAPPTTTPASKSSAPPSLRFAGVVPAANRRAASRIWPKERPAGRFDTYTSFANSKLRATSRYRTRRIYSKPKVRWGNIPTYLSTPIYVYIPRVSHNAGQGHSLCEFGPAKVEATVVHGGFSPFSICGAYLQGIWPPLKIGKIGNSVKLKIRYKSVARFSYLELLYRWIQIPFKYIFFFPSFHFILLLPTQRIPKAPKYLDIFFIFPQPTHRVAITSVRVPRKANNIRNCTNFLLPPYPKPESRFQLSK